MFYTVLCQNSPQPSDQDKLNSIPSVSIFISFYKCRLMQGKAGRGRGKTQATARKDSTAQYITVLYLQTVLLPNTAAVPESGQWYPRSPGRGEPNQRPDEHPGSSYSAPRACRSVGRTATPVLFL